MEIIYWVGDRFECSSATDAYHWAALIIHRHQITRIMQSLAFTVQDYKVGFRQIQVKHGGQDAQWFDIADEGTGFNVCLHLLGFIFCGNLAVKEVSLRGCLHPLVWQVLKKNFSPLATIPCTFLSDSKLLRCAVHPYRTDCDGCNDYEETNKVQPSISWV